MPWVVRAECPCLACALIRRLEAELAQRQRAEWEIQSRIAACLEAEYRERLCNDLVLQSQLRDLEERKAAAWPSIRAAKAAIRTAREHAYRLHNPRERRDNKKARLVV